MSRDHVMWMKVDNMTEDEAIELEAGVKREKARVAPEARGAAFHARKSELPGKIKKALGWSGKNE